MKKLFALVLFLGIWGGVDATSISCDIGGPTSYHLRFGIIFALAGAIYILFWIILAFYKLIRKIINNKNSQRSIMCVAGATGLSSLLMNTVYARASSKSTITLIKESDLPIKIHTPTCPDIPLFDALNQYYSWIFPALFWPSVLAWISLIGHIAILHFLYFVGKKVVNKLKK